MPSPPLVDIIMPLTSSVLRLERSIVVVVVSHRIEVSVRMVVVKEQSFSTGQRVSILKILL